MSGKTSATEAYWRAFKAATSSPAEDYVAVAFGDSAAMADELLALVLGGRKRAGASLARDYGNGEPAPKVGDHVVVVDGRGAPACIWRTAEVEVKPLNAVDERFAWDEGEGDRTRADWLDGHRRYFAKQAAREGWTMHDGVDCVFERFAVIWPPEAADG